MRRITEISSGEWRWVTFMGALFVGLTLLPYALAFALDQSASWRFMGILANPLDGATYLAKIGQGQRGAWLFSLAHTPEVTEAVALQIFYIALGQISRLFGFSTLLTFQLARVITGFTMYLTLYYLGATVWQKQRSRRLFFGLVGMGSGLGWLVLFTGLQSVDLYVPEAIPLYAAYANPHFPLAIGMVALLAAQFITVFRPGYQAMPTAGNGGIIVVALSVLAVVVQPQAWLPFGVALVAYLALQTIRTRRPPQRYELAWTMLYILPALPILAYDLAVAAYDPLYKIWNAQNQTPSGSPLTYAFGFGLLWIVAAPGIIRAARHFERDGDRFMLTWLITNILLLYAPFNLQRRLVIALIIPIGYFCVRSLEDFWLQRTRAPLRATLLAVLFALILPSNIVALVLPLTGVLNINAGLENRQLLTSDYAEAVNWFKVNAPNDSVVMALPDVSLWIPAYSGARVVYGHPFETVYAAQKLQTVKAFYDGSDCALDTTGYRVDYVLIGPVAVPGSAENLVQNPEATPCKAGLGKPLAQFGGVTIYAARPDRP